MKRLRLIWAALFVLALSSAAVDSASAQGVADLRLFEQHCTSCHGNPAAPAGTPDGLQLRKMTP
jgi:mono/diheme cytochrome c family protein